MPAPTTTAVTICNSALLKMGGDIIQALTDSKRAAIVCNTLYDYLRDEVMGASPWRFATKRATLTPTGVTPTFGYDFSYDIPEDCLRPLTTDPDTISWIVEDGQILSDEPTLNMKYLYRNTNEGSWDARFCEAFAWRLAEELCLALTQSIPMRQEMAKGYKDALAQARNTNAVIGTTPPLEADIWSSARRGNYAFRKSAGQTGNP